MLTCDRKGLGSARKENETFLLNVNSHYIEERFLLHKKSLKKGQNRFMRFLVGLVGMKNPVKNPAKFSRREEELLDQNYGVERSLIENCFL